MTRCAKLRTDAPSTPSSLRITKWSHKSAFCLEVRILTKYFALFSILSELLEPVTVCENCVSGPSDCRVSKRLSKVSDTDPKQFLSLGFLRHDGQWGGAAPVEDVHWARHCQWPHHDWGQLRAQVDGCGRLEQTWHILDLRDSLV